MPSEWVADQELLVFCRLVLLRGPADNSVQADKEPDARFESALR